MAILVVQKADLLWQAVLGDLQVQITRPSYETWLKDTVGLTQDDGEIMVGTPSAFVSEMLEQRMYSLISDSVERVLQRTARVRFKVMPSEDMPPGGSLVSSGGYSPGPPTNGSVAEPPARQPAGPRAAAINGRYTFDTFIVGKSNELAHAAAIAVSEKPGVTYNPLFIYSGVGLGKTHLLHAIGHDVQEKAASLIYATTEEFTNQYITAIRDGKTEEFRAKYRSADVLLLDDIQFIIGKEQTQEGFFHTFNALHMAGRQIVLTSDRPPTALTLLEDRIRSRLAGGLTVDIQPPDLETRLAILRAKGEATGQSFPSEVLEFLAERIHSNIRELEGCLNRLAAFAELTGTPIVLDVVKNTVADFLHPSSSRRVSDQTVVDAVCTYFSIDAQTLKGRLRDKPTALARQVAMYLLREESGLPLSAIGRILGGKDHTTVLHAHQRISSQLPTDPHLRQDIITIREAITTP